MTNLMELEPLAETGAERGRLEHAVEALRFMRAGNATVTLVSKRSGTRFTYRLRWPAERPGEAKPDGRVIFVALLDGPDNETNFAFLGTVFDGVTYRTGRKSRVNPAAPSAQAFAWTFTHLVEAGEIPPQVEVWHEGRCGRCGRKLTVPDSIANGFGPDCAALLGRAAER